MEFDDICHLGRNELFGFIALWQCLHVLEYKSCRRYSLSIEDNFLLQSDDSAIKIFKLFSVLEFQGGWVVLNTTIHPSKIRGARMDNTVYNCPSLDFIIMGIYNPVGLSCDGIFYTCVISQLRQQWVSNRSVGLLIPRIVRVITIWDEVLFILRVYFYGLLSRKKVFSESSHRIATQLDVFLEVLEFQKIVNF